MKFIQFKTRKIYFSDPCDEEILFSRDKREETEIDFVIEKHKRWVSKQFEYRRREKCLSL